MSSGETEVSFVEFACNIVLQNKYAHFMIEVHYIRGELRPFLMPLWDCAQDSLQKNRTDRCSDLLHKRAGVHTEPMDSLPRASPPL